MSLVRPSKRITIKCPHCGKEHAITISDPGFHTIRCNDHDIIIFIDEDLNVREINVASIPKFDIDVSKLEFVKEKEAFLPSFADKDRILKILNQEIEPTEKDMMIIKLLLRLGYLRERGE